MSRIAGRHVVLGVSGGIAAYKTCVVARRLAEAGVRVEAVLTAAAAEFVGPVTFEALTGRPVITSLWQSGRALDHVRLGREADLVVVAPAVLSSNDMLDVMRKWGDRLGEQAILAPAIRSASDKVPRDGIHR